MPDEKPKEIKSAATRFTNVISSLLETGNPTINDGLSRILEPNEIGSTRFRVHAETLIVWYHDIIRETEKVPGGDPTALSEPFEQCLNIILSTGGDDTVKANRTNSLAMQLKEQGIVPQMSRCAKILESFNSGSLLLEDDLKKIREDAIQLQKEISEAELDRHLKVVLLEKLFDIQRTIEAYNLFGTEGVRKAAESALAAFVMNMPEVVIASKNSKLNTMMKTFGSFVANILTNTATKTVEKALEPQNIAKLIDTFASN